MRIEIEKAAAKVISAVDRPVLPNSESIRQSPGCRKTLLKEISRPREGIPINERGFALGSTR